MIHCEQVLAGLNIPTPLSLFATTARMGAKVLSLPSVALTLTIPPHPMSAQMGKLFLTPTSLVFHSQVLGFKSTLTIPLPDIRFVSLVC